MSTLEELLARVSGAAEESGEILDASFFTDAVSLLNAVPLDGGTAIFSSGQAPINPNAADPNLRLSPAEVLGEILKDGRGAGPGGRDAFNAISSTEAGKFLSHPSTIA